MKAIKKKEIQLSVKEALTQLVGTFEIQNPSRKTTKLIEKTSKKITKELRDELKKQAKQMQKAGKAKSVSITKDGSVAA
jgi:hypothetical protein